MKGKNKFKGSTAEFIRKCHWLRVRERIIFKICLLVHKCLYGSAPKCLKEMLQYSGSNRTMKLIQPTHKGTYGSRCFARVAPKLWNVFFATALTNWKWCREVQEKPENVPVWWFLWLPAKAQGKMMVDTDSPIYPSPLACLLVFPHPQRSYLSTHYPQDLIDCPTFSVTWIGNSQLGCVGRAAKDSWSRKILGGRGDVGKPMLENVYIWTFLYFIFLVLFLVHSWASHSSTRTSAKHGFCWGTDECRCCG